MEASINIEALEDLRVLVGRIEKRGNGLWRSITLFLKQAIKYLQIDRLVIVFHNLDKVEPFELNQLSRFLKEIPGNQLRIFSTTYNPLRDYRISTQEFSLNALSEKECKEFIDSVFVYPKVNNNLYRILINRSERNPSNLKSILEGMVRQKEMMLSFDPVLGVDIIDRKAFEKIPISKLDYWKSRFIENPYNIKIIACVSKCLTPLTAKDIICILNDASVTLDLEEHEVNKILESMTSSGWLIFKNREGYRIKEPVRREALSNAMNDQPIYLSQLDLPSIHKGIFLHYISIDAPVTVSIPHLVQSPIDFITNIDNQYVLIKGMQKYLDSGMICILNETLHIIESILDKLSYECNCTLRIIELEKMIIKKEAINPEIVEKVNKLVSYMPKSCNRKELSARLLLVKSRFYKDQLKDIEKAYNSIDSIFFKFLQWRNLPSLPTILEFDIWLEYWELCYYTNRENDFVKADKKIWSILNSKNMVLMAMFLEKFLKLHTEHSSEESRCEHLKDCYGEFGGKMVLYHKNKIPILTSYERIQNSFIFEFINTPDKLTLDNNILIGEIFRLSAKRIWMSLSIEERYANNQVIKKYLIPAQSLFLMAGAESYVSEIRVQIGSMYMDNLRIAIQRNDDLNIQRFIAYIQDVLSEKVVDDLTKLGLNVQSAQASEIVSEAKYYRACREPDALQKAIDSLEIALINPITKKDPISNDKLCYWLADMYYRKGDIANAKNALTHILKPSKEFQIIMISLEIESILENEIDISTINTINIINEIKLIEEYIDTNRDDDNICIIEYMNQIIDLNEVIVIMCWLVIESESNIGEGKRALKLLKKQAFRIASLKELPPELSGNIDKLIFRLWDLTDRTNIDIVNDFKEICMPLIENNRIDTYFFDGLVDLLSAWEDDRNIDACNYCASRVSLLLAEHAINTKQMDASCLYIPKTIGLTRPFLLEPKGKAIAPCAKALVLYLCKDKADVDSFRKVYNSIHFELVSANAYTELLTLMVRMVEILLRIYDSNENMLYYDEALSLIKNFSEIEQKCDDLLPILTDLLLIYRQIPGYLEHAQKLLELKCRELLNSEDFQQLIKYLYYLRDHLGKLDKQNSRDKLNLNNSELINAKEMTQLLCADILDVMRREDFDNTLYQHLLSVVASFTIAKESSDIAIAIYIKLYDLESSPETTYVWNIYTALQRFEIFNSNVPLLLNTGIAFITLSLYGTEDQRGRVAINISNPTAFLNYLISIKELVNYLDVLHLTKETHIYQKLSSHYEIMKIAVIEKFIDQLSNNVFDIDLMEKSYYLNFLYEYVFPRSGNCTDKRKIEKLKNIKNELKRKTLGLLSTLSQTSENVFSDASLFMKSHQKRGVTIMQRLVDTFREINTTDILDETVKILRKETRNSSFESIILNELVIEELIDEKLFDSSYFINEL